VVWESFYCKDAQVISHDVFSQCNTGKIYIYVPIPYVDCFVNPSFCKFCAVQKEGMLALSFLRLGGAFLSYYIHTWLRHGDVLHDVSTTLPSTCPLHLALLPVQAPLQFIKLRGSSCTSFAVCPGPEKGVLTHRFAY